MVFEWLGVDDVQWRAVTRTLLKTDFRLPLDTRGSSVLRIGSLLSLVLFMSLFGIGAAAIVFMARDVLLGATIALAYLSVMLVTSLLTQHGATLLSTADYVILGSRPVSSRTFFAIRITNVLFHALLLTTLIAYPVIAAYALTRGAAAVVAATTAIYAWAVAVTLAVVASYSALLQAVGAARFHRAVGYLQLVAGVMAYGGLFLSNRLLGRSALAAATLPDRWWVALIPPSWFTSYVEIAVGHQNSTTLVRAGASMALLAGLVLVLRDRLGLDYARQLAELPVATERPKAWSRRTPFFASQEARAVAILVLAHFRHDLRVRMGVLAVVPLVAIYLMLGTREGPFDLVALAVLMFPALLLQHFVATDAYAAAWVYHTTPASHARLVLALKNTAVVYFLLPFLGFMAAIFLWRMRDPMPALTHTAMLGLLSHLVLQGSTIISPRLPFALPPDKIRGSASLFGWLVVVMIGGQGAVMMLDRWVYVTPERTVAALGSLVLLTAALERVAVWRVGTGTGYGVRGTGWGG